MPRPAALSGARASRAQSKRVGGACLFVYFLSNKFFPAQKSEIATRNGCLFAFSATKAHLNFTPTEPGLAPFRKELATHKTTKNMLQVPYKQPLPEELIRTIAMHRVQVVRDRKDDSFW